MRVAAQVCGAEGRYCRCGWGAPRARRSVWVGFFLVLPVQVAGEREAPLSQDTKVMPSQNGDAQAEGDFVIDADLMCSVCSRPDIEHLMLVCEDCKAGFHTFCLTPPLSGIPDDTWYCQPCAAKRSTASATR